MKDKEWETTTSSQLNEDGFTITTIDNPDDTSWKLGTNDTISVNNNYSVIIQPPLTVGKYIMNEHLHFHFEKKPNWFHRKMTYLLLGWKWEDSSSKVLLTD